MLLSEILRKEKIEEECNRKSRKTVNSPIKCNIC